MMNEDFKRLTASDGISRTHTRPSRTSISKGHGGLSRKPMRREGFYEGQKTMTGARHARCPCQARA
jgi:hypothetical protein